MVVLEGLKSTVSDHSSVASLGVQGGEPSLLLVGNDSRGDIAAAKSSKDTVVSDPSKEDKSTSQSNNNDRTVKTPAKQWKRPWPLLSSSPTSPPDSSISQRIDKVGGQNAQPSPATEVSFSPSFLGVADRVHCS